MATEKKMDVVILGLLNHSDLSGYDIKKQIDSALSFFWSGSYGSIYPTLAKLEADKLVKKKEVKGSERNKAMYSITKAGKKQLLAWLEVPVIKDELRYETLLKLFFGSELGEDGTIEHIEAFERNVSENLKLLQAYEKILTEALDEDPEHKYFLITVKFGIETYKGHLKWCKEAKSMLKNM